MSSVTGAVLMSVALTASVAGGDQAALPRAVLEAGLKKAGCDIPPDEAKVVGTERLSRRLRIVEVTCWRAATNAGSILFAVPASRPHRARLLTIDTWQAGRIVHGYSISSPGYDPKTRTLNSSYKARGAGDCGTIGEWKWTGWHFRLLHVWNKDRCDGTPFEWDSRHGWRVYPPRR